MLEFYFLWTKRLQRKDLWGLLGLGSVQPPQTWVFSCLSFLEPTQLSSTLFSFWFTLARAVWIVWNQRDFNRPTELKSPWGAAQRSLRLCQRTIQCLQQVMNPKGWGHLDGIIPASTDRDHAYASIWPQIKGPLALATEAAFGLGGSTGQTGPRCLVPAEVVHRSWIMSLEPGV